MRIVSPRRDFIIVEDYFSSEQAAKWLEWILEIGTDRERGFHHPDLRPNRFHKSPKYPVKKYMCLGLYWDPLVYSYSTHFKDKKIKPFPIPKNLQDLCLKILKEYFPWSDYVPEAVLVNYYCDHSSMGLHIDKDEENHKAPVIGLNFGSTCRFYFEQESGELGDIRIPGNSLYIFGGTARLMRHGLGTIYSKTLSSGSETYLQNKERVNFTIRQVYN
jgi:DNA alkylation damage repair protein AlkB